MTISLTTNLLSNFTSLQISCHNKSRLIRRKLGKFLNNFLCNKQQVEENNADEEDDFFTPRSSIMDIEFETPTYVCEICVETKPLDISFNIKGCSHFYCIECTVKYIESKLDDNVTRIACPVTNCDGVLDPEFCRGILPRGLFNRWGNALCESAFLESEKFYCPYKDCSTLMINDGKRKGSKKFKCPFCKRVCCLRCKVAWHSGLGCTKFQKLEPLGSDAMFADLAKKKKWKQCPVCKVYVVKRSGCSHVQCRCGIAFCYNCGEKWRNRNALRNHYCYKDGLSHSHY